MRRMLLLAVVSVVSLASPVFSEETAAESVAQTPEFRWDVWRDIVVLDGGRTKPFDTLAWETIYKIAKRSKVKPEAVATIGIADVKDWSQFAKALTAGANSPIPKIAGELSPELIERIEGTDFDVMDRQREALSLDQSIDERLEEFVLKVGIPKTRAEFREEAVEPSDRKTFERFDELVAELDKVGQVKADVLHAVNASLPIRELVPDEFLEQVGAQDSGKLDPFEVATAHRRYIESKLPEVIEPLTDAQLPIGHPWFSDHKFGSVELAVLLALTWEGWDDPDAVQKLFEGDERRITFDSAYRIAAGKDVWDTLPIIDARYNELAPKLIPETPTGVSVRTVFSNPWFLAWAQRAIDLKGNKEKKAELTTFDNKAVEVAHSFQAYVLLRTGQSINLGPDANIKPRVDFIRNEMADLEATLAKGGDDPVQVVEQWLNAPERSQGPDDAAIADVRDIAQRLSKELSVHGAEGASAMIEQQTRLKTEEIANGVRWLSVLDILARPDRMKENGYDAETANNLRESLLATRSALLDGNATAFNEASEKFAGLLSSLGSESQIYPPETQIATELHYNSFQPFLWTAVLAGLSLLILVLSLPIRSSIPYGVGLVTLVSAVGMMVYGMYLRIAISGRPPVTNMYETIVWASFIMVSMATVFGIIYRNRMVVTVAAMTLTPATLLAYVIPPEYGASIDPLVPVLRDNFWLVIHVLTIVASYGAFMLAWMLGNVGLAMYLVGQDKPAQIKPVALFIYRSMQVGILLLAAGTILGGWWAAYSWGRFWGWDPKEVWALIALVGYLAVLHARFAGMIKVFGLTVCSVLAFSGVMMSWYGVNFVLGEGKHAYAFGSGGQGYVFAAVLANVAFVCIVAAVRRARMIRRKSGEDQPSNPEALTSANV